MKKLLPLALMAPTLALAVRYEDVVESSGNSVSWGFTQWALALMCAALALGMLRDKGMSLRWRLAWGAGFALLGAVAWQWPAVGAILFAAGLVLALVGASF